MKNKVDLYVSRLKNKYPKIDKIYDFINFVIEFIVSLIFAISVYKISYIKSSIGVISRFHLTISIIFITLIIANIIINIIKYKEKIEKIFLSFIIPIGMLYLVLLLPYYVPDEAPHIIRAYEVYRGEFISSLNENNQHRAVIPKDLADIKLNNLNSYLTLQEQLSKKTNYNECIEGFTEAQSYPGILYLISGLGLKIGQILNLNIIISMYLGRIFNFIFFLIMAYYAVKKIPFGKLVLSSYLLMPMVLQQAASVSPDSLINGVCIFFISYVLYLTFKAEKIKRIEIIMCVLISIFIAIAKVVYLPLVFLLFLLIFNKKLNKKGKIILIVTSIIISILLGAFWYFYQTRYQDERDYVKERNINSTEQIKNIISNPIGFIEVIKNTTDTMGQTYLYGMIGNSLGWQNIQINDSLILLYFSLLILSVWFEKNECSFTKLQRIYVLLIALGTILLIFTAMYLGWTEVGAGIIVGIQGRYFIPIAVLLLLVMCLKDNYIKLKNIKFTYFIIITLINSLAIYEIQQFFM